MAPVSWQDFWEQPDSLMMMLVHQEGSTWTPKDLRNIMSLNKQICKSMLSCLNWRLVIEVCDPTQQLQWGPEQCKHKLVSKLEHQSVPFTYDRS
jgi:hypothetical protein